MEKLSSTLFGKTRRALLAKLFVEPDRDFRLREISRLTSISPGSVQHELKQLLHADLVVQKREHGLVTYRANKASPIYDELRSIVEKTSGINELIRKSLEPVADRIRCAFIYGSIAKGSNKSRSDVDLLVVGSIDFGDLVKRLHPVEERIGREISPRLFSEREYRKRIASKDRFLSSVLDERVVPIVGEMNVAG
jgi:predicted nucleotidyltransferase